MSVVTVLTSILVGISVEAAKPRARDLGIPLSGTPGRLNAITDVTGIEVGFATITAGQARTGVTAVLPRGRRNSKVPAATFALNGNGEMTGTTWIEESGFLEGPVMLTNTFSVGIVRDAVRAWGEKHFPNNDPDVDDAFMLPIVAETWDGLLNDIKGFHVKPEHAFEALDSASGGRVQEGSVGGGTGMVCFQFKCGTGTSSRKVKIAGKEYAVGILVQANYGRRPELRVAGIPVGPKLTDLMPKFPKEKRDGSIIVVVATDAPLRPGQLKRVARRASLGIANTGGIAHNSSGDIFIAFSTVSPKTDRKGLKTWKTLSNENMDEIFRATVEATEESILNALVAGETTTGIDGNVVHGLPHDKLLAILKKHARLN